MSEELTMLISLQAQINRLQDTATLQAKNVLNIDDLVLLTGLSKGRIYHLCSANEIPYYKQGKIYFKRTEIEQWLTAVRIPTSAEVQSKAIATTL